MKAITLIDKRIVRRDTTINIPAGSVVTVVSPIRGNWYAIQTDAGWQTVIQSHHIKLES